MLMTLSRLATAALCACLVSSAQAAPPLPAPLKLAAILRTNAVPATTGFVDAGDHFLGADGKTIPLWRAPDELAVRYSNDHQPARPAGVTPRQHANFRQKGRFEIVRAPKTIARDAGVRFAYPVLLDPRAKTRMLPTDELLLRLADNVTPADARADLAAAGVAIIEATGPPQSNTYLARLTRPKADDPLAASRRLAALPKLRWAAPNFVRELRWHKIPADPLFPHQQSLRNTGQNGAVPGADINATMAWDVTTGANSIIIAIIDEGVETNHADLAIAPGGWDFANNDADPSPVGNHAHGTACAGIAAARHNTSLVAGVAGGCRVLPVKIADDTGAYTTDEILGNAIVFASTRADVLSNSWGGGAPNPFIDAAVEYAAAFGRAGKGCPVFFATGNSATSWQLQLVPISMYKDYILSQSNMTWQGQYHLAFCLATGNDPALSTNETVRIDDVYLLGPDGRTHLGGILPNTNFELFDFWWNPANQWLFSTVNPWQMASDNVFTGTGGSLAAAAASNLGTNQQSWMLTPLLPLDGNEIFAFHWSIRVSTNATFYLFLLDSTFSGIGAQISGYDSTGNVNTNLSYPASAPNAIAVGSSTDCDYRSDFSQYAGKLDFLAPGGYGWNQITTLDITGANGYSNTDFTHDFAGTSAACPHAAGVAALLLSVNPNLTSTEVRDIMRRTCDKIGSVTYTGGTNLFYGHGRLNAWRALAELVPDLALAVTAAPEPVSLGSNITYTITVTNLSATHPATGVVLTNTLSTGVAFLNATASQGACVTDAFGHVIANLGALPTNAPAATVTITATASQYGYLTNTATVALHELDATISNNTATVVSTVPAADLGVSQFAVPLPATANNLLTYLITVTNLGPTTATSVTVTDALPAGVTFLAASATQGSCATDTVNNVIASLGLLSPGAAATIQCTVRLPAITPADYTNTLTAAAAQTDPVPANNTSLLLTSVALDSVGDGIPDWWRALYSITAAGADPDGDGQSNLHEFLAGTDPTLSASALRIRDVALSNNVFAVTFDTAANKLYRVEWTANLVTGPWTNLTATVIFGTGNPVTVPDPGVSGQSKRFYRVRLAPAP